MSTAAQNGAGTVVLAGHDTELIPIPPVSIAAGGLHVPLSYVTSFPALSTATQYVSDEHDTDVKELLSIVDGKPHVPFW